MIKLYWVYENEPIEPSDPLEKAILLVKEHFPKLSMVVFSKEGKWCYMDEDFEGFNFKDKIDITLKIWEIERTTKQANDMVLAISEAFKLWIN